jgi:hypothetical protein
MKHFFVTFLSDCAELAVMAVFFASIFVLCLGFSGGA